MQHNIYNKLVDELYSLDIEYKKGGKIWKKN